MVAVGNGEQLKSVAFGVKSTTDPSKSLLRDTIMSNSSKSSTAKLSSDALGFETLSKLDEDVDAEVGNEFIGV